jgi:rare lipoprotein A
LPRFELQKIVMSDCEFLETERMPMTAGQRTLTLLSVGLLFLNASGKASLEKIENAHHAQTAQDLQVAKVQTLKLKGRKIASWYGRNFKGRKTASGEAFDGYKLTAAHRTLPFGSLVKLTAVRTGRSVVVRINDRGPSIKGRDFHLSEMAATELGIHGKGFETVEATVFESRFAAIRSTRKR